MSGFLIDFHGNLSVDREDYYLVAFYYIVFVVVVRQVDIHIAKKYLKPEKEKLSYVEYNTKMYDAIDSMWPRADTLNPSLLKIMWVTRSLFLSVTFFFFYVIYKTWF